ncbi:hypothetical protein BPT24_158 [Tenacibaculum phage pT24]|uniref:Uncharacterized protein n=1 Tax=Tenacibaculum phage pT24 TaxID=1880590 RepID=A0A1W7GKQ1_9CAUD|nr:hypothetical protein HYP10_gp158 [Tenacibaculum phage pT24]BAX25560.1 hypothetical protein BPT24_158 [Tenacibaculum phage pT24]
MKKDLSWDLNWNVIDSNQIKGIDELV